ncbi:MAG: hypothetical protein KatS3mg077_2738 [Candidatus Binatia bacterium]|nr:MAG: hypothetical protein KatS3mg077_2738 [Candidatus Binatia bacterium]
MVRSVSHEAIILRVRPYGELDQIVTFLTDGAGKLTGIAKAAKHSRRRFANCLDPLARVRVHYRPRPGPGLVFMERCDLRRPATVYTDLHRLAYAQYLAELVDVITEEAHAVPELFSLLDEALALLVTGPASAPLLRAFELQLLRHAGYQPNLATCARCRADTTADTPVVIDLERSSALCARCAGGVDQPTLFRAQGSTLAALERLCQLPLALAQTQRFDPSLHSEALLILSGLLAPHLRRPLRSLKVLQQLGQSSP